MKTDMQASVPQRHPGGRTCAGMVALPVGAFLFAVHLLLRRKTR